MKSDASSIIIYTVAAIATIALASALGYRGSTKGYSFWLCFLLALSTTPLLGWLIITLLPEREQKYTTPPELKLAIELEKARMAGAKNDAT